MRTGKVWAAVAGVLLLAALAQAVSAGEEAPTGVLTLDKVPAAVKATIEKESEGTKLLTLLGSTQGDKTTYHATLTGEKKLVRLKVDADGTLLSKLTGEQLTLEEVPAPVKAAIEKEARNAKIEKVQRVTVDGKARYNAELVHADKRSGTRLAVDPEGKLLGKMAVEQLGPDELPAAIKAAVQKELPEGKILGGHRGTTEGKSLYGVVVTVGDKALFVQTDEEGKVIGKPTEFGPPPKEALPPPR